MNHEINLEDFNMKIVSTILFIVVSSFAFGQEKLYHSLDYQQSLLSEKREWYNGLSNESLVDTINWENYLLIIFKSENFPMTFLDFPMKKYLNFDQTHLRYLRIAVAVEILEKRGSGLNMEEMAELASGFLRLEEYKKAITWSTNSIDKLNENTGIADRDRVALYTIRAKSKAGLEDYFGAISDFQAISENSPYANFNIGYYYLKLERYPDAIASFSTTIELAQNHEVYREAFYYRGISYLNSNNLEAGCKDLSLAGQYGIESATDLIDSHCK